MIDLVDNVESVNAVVGWNIEEKISLLHALKSYGSNDVEAIHDSIPSKTPEQIITAINHYKKEAMRRKELAEKNIEIKRFKKPQIPTNPRVPLVSWAKLLTDSMPFKELHTETVTAVRLIALLDKMPPAVCTENIDFRKIYHQIAGAMEGKPIPDDKTTGPMLKKCMIETALTSKAFIRATTFRSLMNSLDISDKDIKVFPKPSEDYELVTLRHMISQRAYNPLHIPEHFLKPFEPTKE